VRVKHGIALALSVGIICLLVSPSLELGSVYSGKSLHNFFPLVMYALMGPVWLLLVPGAHPMKTAPLSQDDFLDRICVRLC
jgi:hypothetical protein